MISINEIKQKFEQDLAADGKSPKTILSYVGDVRRFLQWLNEKKLHSRGR